MSEMFVSEA